MSCRKNLSLGASASERSESAPTGRRYWRSLEALSETDEFRRLIEREFPSQLGVAFDPVNRRKFLTLMGASLALAGVGGCSVKPAPTKDIVPYVRQPEELIPGKPLFYASAMTLDGAAVGLLIETHLGRPTKVEGNPDHPASLGATSVQQQAAVLELYDPDRSQVVRHLGQTRTWADALGVIRGMIESQRPKRGAGLRFLSEAVVSPTAQEQMEAIERQFPDAKWHFFEPMNCDAVYRGATLAFGRPILPRYDLTQADVVLSLDSDFLISGPQHLRLAADFMQRRRPSSGLDSAADATMNRLYVVESMLTCTGAKADHRLALRGRDIEPLARAVAAAIGSDLGSAADGTSVGDHQKWVSAIARDLNSHRGRCLVIAGDRQPAEVHLLAHAMNDRLGNVGKTVEYIAPIEARPDDRASSLAELSEALGRGEVDCLVILGGNPALSAPADIPFVEQMKKTPLRIHFGLYEDETARICHWHLPAAHFMEAWSDTRAFDGTASIVQPVIEPLHEGRSLHELLALFTDLRETPGQGIVSASWRRRWAQESADGDFESRWQSALHDGIVAGSRAKVTQVSLSESWRTELKSAGGAGEAGSSESGASSAANGENDLELVFAPDPSLFDGRFANNGWLQELPKPISKLTWGNAAMMSPRTAKRLGLKMGSYAHGGEHGGYYMPVVELQIDGRAATAPLWIMPGQADDSVTLYLGYGREYAGRIGGMPGEPIGCNAYPLRTSKQPWFAGGLRVVATGRTELVACTQEHHAMEGRAPVQVATLKQFHDDPNVVKEHIRESSEAEESRKARQMPASSSADSKNESKAAEAPLNLYEPFDYSAPKHKWGMSIDLTSCIGCNACVVACQAENNIPVVGKEEVARGREMHWIRVDRYMEGSPDEPGAFHFQPLPCMHCENAPCEYVCPVGATLHSSEGLNEMIYNRCVGTRFCSNNCPYKVRRFNFLFFADFQSPERRMQYNPDVTVRSRGVMEKCSYCVQRIREGEIGAQTSGRPLRDGDVVTACQAACPTRAIVFGDINDAKSQVKERKDSPLDYSLLDDLNTVPRTTYLAELRNPNPELEGA